MLKIRGFICKSVTSLLSVPGKVKFHLKKEQNIYNKDLIPALEKHEPQKPNIE